MILLAKVSFLTLWIRLSLIHFENLASMAMDSIEWLKDRNEKLPDIHDLELMMKYFSWNQID